jgi:hypothetical protein
MKILVYYPSNTQPKSRYFDGPLELGLQQAIGEQLEKVPGFTSFRRMA